MQSENIKNKFDKSVTIIGTIWRHFHTGQYTGQCESDLIKKRGGNKSILIPCRIRDPFYLMFLMFETGQWGY